MKLYSIYCSNLSFTFNKTFTLSTYVVVFRWFLHHKLTQRKLNFKLSCKCYCLGLTFDSNRFTTFPAGLYLATTYTFVLSLVFAFAIASSLVAPQTNCNRKDISSRRLTWCGKKLELIITQHKLTEPWNDKAWPVTLHCIHQYIGISEHQE